MENALALLRLALERLWTVGLILVLFCAGALEATSHGVELPQPVTQWSTAGLILGAAFIIASWLILIPSWTVKLVGYFSRKRAGRAEEEEEARAVRANLAAMTRDDAIELEYILSSGAPRFQVHIYEPRHRLLELGLVKPVRFIQHGYICELHPTLAAEADNLRRHLREQLQSTLGPPR
jgi:hypothetical protein